MINYQRPLRFFQAIAASEGICTIAEAINKPAGKDSFNLRAAEKYIRQFGSLVKESMTLLIQSLISKVCGMFCKSPYLIKKKRNASA